MNTPTFQPIEMFIADPHGEYEEFSHIVRSACGQIREAIDQYFGEGLNTADKDELATFICYPLKKINAKRAECGDDKTVDWGVRMMQYASALLAYLTGNDDTTALKSPVEMALAVQNAAVSHLYLLGDVFDRGPAPDRIMDELSSYPHYDIIWGNHDILWMGAALGQPACALTVARICARYGNLSILEKNYHIDLQYLYDFANYIYRDDPCTVFAAKSDVPLSDEDLRQHARVQKALALMQFKVEAALIHENPSFGLESRDLLSAINFAEGTVRVDGKTLPLLDTNFPTVDPHNPCALTPEEAAVVTQLVGEFVECGKLQTQIQLFLRHGSLYKVAGDNLLIHACVPLNSDGTLMPVSLFGETLSGKVLYDRIDALVREAFDGVFNFNESGDGTSDEAPMINIDANTYAQASPAKKQAIDLLWYLWLAPGSPLFAKSKMATFELYFVDDKDAQKEAKNAFYNLLDDEHAIDAILREFGLDPAHARIICGHVPVKASKGESPIKSNGKLLMIDGGMSAPYQKTTGIAGYTLVVQNGTYRLAAHEAFCGTAETVAHNTPHISHWIELN